MAANRIHGDQPPESAIFTLVKLNADPESEAGIAVSSSTIHPCACCRTLAILSPFFSPSISLGFSNAAPFSLLFLIAVVRRQSSTLSAQHRTCYAYRLASRWLAGSQALLSRRKARQLLLDLPFPKSKFIPGREHRWLLTVSEGIWSALTLDNITLRSEWSPKGAIFAGVKLNADPGSEAGVAVSLSLHEIRSVDIDLCPVSITGDVITLDDDGPKTLVYNWKMDNHTLLWLGRRHQRDTDLNPHPIPERQSLGIRAKLTRVLLILPLSSILTSEVSSRRGTLRCTDVILSRQATAVWICPHDRAMVSHCEEHDGCETPIAADFPGPLNPSAEICVREVYMNALNNWPVLDYGEDLGMIALGSGFGKIAIVKFWTNYIHPTGIVKSAISYENRMHFRDAKKLVVCYESSHHDFSLRGTGRLRDAQCSRLPGPLNPTAEVRVRYVCMNSLNNWTTFDYDEDFGRITLGSGFRAVKIVQL
ncbi:hypothetical protein EV421DRAFT_2023269 [Armillaria borealis]|uniref:Uncharacterized protein n=1 Tax=Armillaria borealis TaxID=47425 RepID=A0AA39J0G7_9AGAR|nr:hypothetical protein EV421DRAFT_2023269 [Armillaria borealis]